MRFTGHFSYEQPPETVYRTFTDRDALMYATPGVQSLEEIAPDQYQISLRAGYGGFYLYWNGTLTVTDRIPDQQYRLLIDATTHNGYVKGEGVFRFLPQENGGTRLEYEADMEMGGAQKLLLSLARGLVDFFLYGMKHWLKETAAGRVPAGVD